MDTLRLNPKDVLYLLGIATAGAVTWGAMTQRLSAQERALEELKPVSAQYQVISGRIDAIDQRTVEIWKDVREIREQLKK